MRVKLTDKVMESCCLVPSLQLPFILGHLFNLVLSHSVSFVPPFLSISLSPPSPLALEPIQTLTEGSPSRSLAPSLLRFLSPRLSLARSVTGILSL